MKLVFLLVFMAAASPMWTLMIVAPRWEWTRRIMSSPWSITPPLIFWFAFAVPRLAELLPEVLKPTLGGWSTLLQDPAALTFVWAQIIAWDLFVGRWMYLDSRARGLHPGVMAPFLVTTIMLSPIAVPLYLLVRGRLPRQKEKVVKPDPPAGFNKPLLWFAAFSAVVGVIAVTGLIVDDRVLVDAPIWAKAAKFSISFGLYALTLSWLISLQTRRTGLGQRIGTITAIMCFIEVGVVVLQTFRGHRSHFNVSTAFDAIMWAIMASSILVLWIANLVGAGLLLKERCEDRSMLWALRFGTIITLVGMAVAFMMTLSSAEQRAQRPRQLIGAHSVGVDDGGPSLPVTGWSETGGDLRVPHFIGVHALQAVPLIAILLTVFMGALPRLRDELVRVRLVWTFSGYYTGLMVLTTWQALRGQSVVSPDGWTIGVFVTLTLAAIYATVWALVAPTPTPPEPEPRPEPVREEAQEALV